MKVSQKGIDLIKRWEGLRLEAYQDGGGVWTIGYGLTSAAGIIEVKRGLKITPKLAEEYLVRALPIYSDVVERVIKRPMTQPQFDAMSSLCYNIGPSQFEKSSVVRRFNDGDIMGAANAFLMWVKDNGREIEGLKNRRADERKVFLSSYEYQPPAVAEPKPAPPLPPLPEPLPVPPPVTPPPNPGSGIAAIVLGAAGALIAALVAWIMRG